MNKIRWWDFVSVILLLAALVSVTVRLNNTEWTKHLEITEVLVILGGFLGVALGFTRFSSRLVFLMAVLYGVFIIPWQVSRLVENISQKTGWLEILLIIKNRLETVIFQLIRNEVVLDSIFFIVLMAVLFWFLGVFSGYILVRHGNAWIALLPPGVALLVIHLFDPLKDNRVWYFAAFIFFSLMLIGRVTFLRHQERWQQNRTAMPPYLGLDFLRFSLFTTSTIILLTWILPAVPTSFSSIRSLVEPVQNQWNEFKESFDNVFASLKTTLNVPVDYYGPTLSLGSGNKLTDEVMFWVEPPRNIPNGVRLYWRARVYSAFDGRQWSSPSLESDLWNSESQLNLTEYEQRWDTEFNFISSSFFTALLLPAQPEWTDRPGFVDFLQNPDASLDLYSFRAEPLVRPSQIYKVQSSISKAEIYDMRTSGTDYPEWIGERYLQLAPTITDRTILLAQEITAGLDNPYDKTMAITQFMRDNIPYSETIPPPPFNQDAVDWFLFDYRTGFCNYYASATVTMLRSLGIPSRLVVGYATGEEQDNVRFVVRQREAHAWPEVYFSGLGWVEFEPTPSQPVIERLPGVDPNEANSALTSPGVPLSGPTPMLDDQLFMDQNLADNQADSSGASGSARLVITMVIIALLFLLIILYARLKTRFNLRPFPVILESTLKKIGFKPPAFIQDWAIASSLPQLTKSYQEINNALVRLGKRPDPTSTPAERALTLNLIIPSAEPYTNLVVFEYQLGLFSTQPPDILSAQKASDKIRQLSYQDYFQRLLYRIKSISLSPKKKRQSKSLR